jgi:hypothetical protein
MRSKYEIAAKQDLKLTAIPVQDSAGECRTHASYAACEEGCESFMQCRVRSFQTWYLCIQE